MPELFTRHGTTAHPGKSYVDPKGRPYFVQKKRCGRCGGAGHAEQWRFTGYKCYDCGGAGHLGDESVNLYTAEEITKLNERKAKADAKRAAKAQAKADAINAERAARAESFRANYADLFELAGPYMDDSFVGDVITKALTRSEISEKAEDAVRKAVARIAARAEARANSGHVGAVGERLKGLEVTVERIASFERPVFGASWKSETVWIITMRDANGNAIISKSPSFHAEKGEKLTIAATVKEHGSYNDEKQTVVQRIKATITATEEAAA